MRRAPSRESVVSEPLLRQLIAAGQADVLVGMVTHENAATAGGVARAAVEAFGTAFVRERCVILAADGGSRDGTIQVVRAAAQHAAGLRTVHCITAAHAGLPGRAGGLRLIFTAAELLRARAVCVLDPAGESASAEDVARWISPVLHGGVDLVRPVLPRSPWEAPLLTQLLRPLLSAATGMRLQEPADPELCVSAELARVLLGNVPWAGAQDGVEVWMSAIGLTGDFRLAQVALARPAPPPSRARLRTVFPQLVGAALDLLGLDTSWRAARGVQDVEVLGEVPAALQKRPAFDTRQLRRDFDRGMGELGPLLATFLEPERLDDLTAGKLDDESWARLVWGFVDAASRRVMGARQLGQALLPVYEGRVASFLRQAAALDPAAVLERIGALESAFVATKPGVSHG